MSSAMPLNAGPESPHKDEVGEDTRPLAQLSIRYRRSIALIDKVGRCWLHLLLWLLLPACC